MEDSINITTQLNGLFFISLVYKKRKQRKGVTGDDDDDDDDI